jgi:hypothetical protein
MRYVVVLALVGCSGGDPCTDHDGACLALRVTGAGAVDQLHVVISGQAELDGRTPPVPGAAHALPVRIAVFLPDPGGGLVVGVGGFLRGALVGEGVATVNVPPRAHRSVEIALSAPMSADLAVPLDLAVADLAAPDLAASDLAGDLGARDDLSAADALPDLRFVDQVMAPPRHVFVMATLDGALGTLQSLDDNCTSLAAGVLSGTSYRAVIAYPGVDAFSHVTLNAGRAIALPDGTAVATDSTFFTITHQHGIDQLADTTPVVASCVWTQMGPGGARINAPDCTGWTSTSSLMSAVVGNTGSSDVAWATSGTMTCDQSCYVYCIEQ